MADAALVENLQKQLDRLMNQLSDIEEERPNMEPQEYEELKSETMDELKDLSRTLEKMTGGDITVVDNLTATRMAVRAAISEAFRTPEIVALFAKKQPAALRQKLIVMDSELRMHKLLEKEYNARKLEILTALVNLKEELSAEEKSFLQQKHSEVSMAQKKRKRLLEMPGLPKPWSAYMHVDKKRVFYHNTETGESLWELPSDVKAKCRTSVDELGSKLDETFTATIDASDGIEAMDYADWDGNSPTEVVEVEALHPSTSRPGTSQDDCEDMEVDFSEDLRQMRGTSYDHGVISKDAHIEESFSLAGTSRSCVVLDTCALIDDPELISNCIEKNVAIVIPYRVFYELDSMRKLSASSTSAVQLRQRATRVVHKLRDLRTSALVYWESSKESFTLVEGFMTSSTEDVNDDFILKCAYRMKLLLDARNEGWETVFITNDNVLSLKAHANAIPCYSGKEAKAILTAASTSAADGRDTEKMGKAPTKRRASPPNTTPKRNQLREKKPEHVSPKKPQPITSTEASPKKGQKKDSTKATTKAEKDPLKVFSKTWNELATVLRNRCKKNSSKSVKDVCRLRECTSSYCESRTEKNLSMLVRMTYWLSFYYFPPARNDATSKLHKELMKNGLFKQMNTKCPMSDALTLAFRKFINDFKSLKEQAEA